MAMNAGMTLSVLVMVVLATAVDGSTAIEGNKGYSQGVDRHIRDGADGCCVEFMQCSQQCVGPQQECWDQCWEEASTACKERVTTGYCIMFEGCYRNCHTSVQDCTTMCEYEAKYKSTLFSGVHCSGFHDSYADCRINTDLPAKYYCFQSNKHVAC